MNHLVILIPGGVVHHKVDEAVDGVHDEGDGPEADAGGGPLPAGLRHVGDRLGHARQRVGADPVNGEACRRFFVRGDIIFFLGDIFHLGQLLRRELATTGCRMQRGQLSQCLSLSPDNINNHLDRHADHDH